jgi:hypothetical protein
MAGGRFQTLVTGVSVPVASSYTIDLDLSTVYDNMKLLFGINYASSFGASAVTCTVFGGYGDADSTATMIGGLNGKIGGSSTPIYTTTGTAVTFNTPVVGSTIYTDLLVRSSKYDDQVPRWLRLKFTNTHATVAPTLSIYGSY